ncbi:MAG TPA: hypothetical protein VJ770_27025 [Stellaceae bacterium]|nr:hypothetical protein [Stellaceae bacterium]
MIKMPCKSEVWLRNAPRAVDWSLRILCLLEAVGFAVWFYFDAADHRGNWPVCDGFIIAANLTVAVVSWSLPLK